MRGIGKEEVILLGMVIFSGLTGSIVKSCTSASVSSRDIEERQHEFDIKNPAPPTPCKEHSALLTGSFRPEECNPGETPSYKDLGLQNTGPKIWLFCTCPKEEGDK
jgi:hypothetical protein